MTGLPIDYRRGPWREKYIFEETTVLNSWFIFGTYPDGSVGITDGDTDILAYVPKAAAEEIIAARTVFLEKMAEHLTQPRAGDLNKRA